MFLPVLLIGLVFGSVYACDNPNNTDTTFSWFNCRNPTDAITVNSVTVTDDQGNPNYPFDIHRPIVLHAKSTMAGSTVVNMMWEDVKLSAWGGILGCSWHTVPTGPLLNNIKQCGNCPLHPGALALDYKIDLTPFASIISLLANGGVYQFEVHLKNGDTSAHEQIGCITVQGKIKKT